KITDPLAYAAEFGYDDLDRLIKSLDAMTGESAQSFDADGNRDSLADPNQNRTGFHFDLSGRLIEESSAAGGSVKYAWNARNLLEKLTNARGRERVFQYDAARRLSGFADADGTVSRTYDNNGNLLTVSDENGTITRVYDALNRVTAYTDIRGDTIRYAYDSRGRLQTLTYPDGRIVTYAYNAAGRLARVADWAGRETLYTYNANGRLIQTVRPNGTQMARVYNAAGQLQQQTDTGPDGELIARFDFTYDAAGDISTEKTLPAAPRLSVALSAEMSYGADNRLMTYNGEAVRFDADGNMIHGPLNGGMADFSFDSCHRLTGAGNTQYIYDAENQRIAVNADGQETRYTVNSQPLLSQVLVRTKPDGTQTYYVYGLGLIGEESDEIYRTYHFDLRGSTVALTNEAGAAVERFQYSPYGMLVSHSAESLDTSFLFNGMYGVMTDASALYYMRARYYNPEIRRFVNQDVLRGNVSEGHTLNRFAYVVGNPIKYIDPRGLEVERWGRPADFSSPYNHVDHHWLKTDKYESGMGPLEGVPGQDGTTPDLPFFTPVYTTDHSGQSDRTDARQIPLPFPVDEECVNKYIRPGRSLGNFLLPPYYHCQAFTYDVLQKCRSDRNMLLPGDFTPFDSDGWW
ncbi:MAG: RHS repeat-associated core domain-containing protein, partial [Gammaproteobacteria bacterium]|nr:RHS repeat-associated core domain-containing protein [Gammaproteobacteria bacterium]